MNDNKENRFGLYISIINRAAQGYFYRRLRNFKIGPGQQAYLLSISPGETIVQDELAKRLKVDKANVTRALKGLENHGYILRTRSKKDKRAWEISLTEPGVKTRLKVENISKEWVEILKEPLSTDDWNALGISLKKIAESLQGPGCINR